MSMNQKTLAAALGIAPATVTKWKKLGMPTNDVAAAQAWRSQNVGLYIRCEKPAPPMPSAATPLDAERPAPPPLPAGDGSTLDLAQERAMLAREQRLGIEMKNAVARGEYAPITLLSRVLAAASQAVVDRLDQLPARLRKTCPDLPDAARAEVMAAIADARNEWVSATVELVAAGLDADDADDLAEDTAELGTA